MWDFVSGDPGEIPKPPERHRKSEVTDDDLVAFSDGPPIGCIFIVMFLAAAVLYILIQWSAWVSSCGPGGCL